MTTDFASLSRQAAALTALLQQFQEQLKDVAVREAVANGSAVIVRPEYFSRPVRARTGQPGNADPWFGLTQSDWNVEIEAGFKGWYKTTESSVRAKVMIHYESARKWLEAKMEKQRGHAPAVTHSSA